MPERLHQRLLTSLAGSALLLALVCPGCVRLVTRLPADSSSDAAQHDGPRGEARALERDVRTLDRPGDASKPPDGSPAKDRGSSAVHVGNVTCTTWPGSAGVLAHTATPGDGMVVFIAARYTTQPTLATASYGKPLSLISSPQYAGAGIWVWHLPPAPSHSAAGVTFDFSGSLTALAACMIDVSGTPTSSSGSKGVTGALQLVTGACNGLYLDLAMTLGYHSLTPALGQILNDQVVKAAVGTTSVMTVGSSRRVGASTASMTWTQSGNAAWQMAGVCVMP